MCVCVSTVLSQSYSATVVELYNRVRRDVGSILGIFGKGRAFFTFEFIDRWRAHYVQFDSIN